MSYVVYLTHRRHPDVRAAGRRPRKVVRDGQALRLVAATLHDGRTKRFDTEEAARQWLAGLVLPPRWRARIMPEISGKAEEPTPCPATKS